MNIVKLYSYVIALTFNDKIDAYLACSCVELLRKLKVVFVSLKDNKNMCFVLVMHGHALEKLNLELCSKHMKWFKGTCPISFK